jgi:hypothetical protein
MGTVVHSFAPLLSGAPAPLAESQPQLQAEAQERARSIVEYSRTLAQDHTSVAGYVMELGYDAGVIITNDYYKLRVGGLPKNCFLLIRPGPLQDLVKPDHALTEEKSFASGGRGGPHGLFDLPRRARQQATASHLSPHLILARVLEPAATPLAQDVSRTYFEMRKSQAPEIDVFTRGELQWGAMRVSVLGTFFDHPDPDREPPIVFGGDVQNFLSPHLYSVHMPPPAVLEELINAFVDPQTRRPIGAVRLTESLPAGPASRVSVYVSPADFIGARTALFGKTRTGKSNTVKVIAQMVLDSVGSGRAKVGQLIFDLNGEYAYHNGQDPTCLYDLYSERCVRYSLRPRLPQGVRPLKADFFGDLRLGHKIITELFRQQEGQPPDYMKAFFEWEPLSESEVRALERDDREAATRYQRQESVYRCVLHEAGFEHANDSVARLHLNREIRAFLAERMPGLAQAEEDGSSRVPQALPLEAASAAYRTLWEAYDPAVELFRNRSGREYLDDTARSMLTVLCKSRPGVGSSVSGYSKLVPFRRYHCREGGRLLDEIVEAIDASKTVILDLSNAAEELVEFFGGMVCSAVFKRQMDKFTSDRLGEHFVQFYFEEAHNLFPRDDRNLRNIYNRLAKEGAKLHVGIVYSTQSIESLSPDLLKNTENFFITHLNDEREIRALTRFHEFRDVGGDVQRTKARGFVRMITKSHRFALPVQVRKFKGKAEG